MLRVERQAPRRRARQGPEAAQQQDDEDARTDAADAVLDRGDAGAADGPREQRRAAKGGTGADCTETPRRRIASFEAGIRKTREPENVMLRFSAACQCDTA